MISEPKKWLIKQKWIYFHIIIVIEILNINSVSKGWQQLITFYANETAEECDKHPVKDLYSWHEYWNGGHEKIALHKTNESVVVPADICFLFVLYRRRFKVIWKSFTDIDLTLTVASRLSFYIPRGWSYCDCSCICIEWSYLYLYFWIVVDRWLTMFSNMLNTPNCSKNITTFIKTIIKL